MIEVDQEINSVKHRLWKMKKYIKNKEINVCRFERKLLETISTKLQMKT